MKTKTLLAWALAAPLVVGNVPVTALAADDEARATETPEATAENEDTSSSGWQFRWFGTSTNEDANKLIQGIEDGADLSKGKNGEVVKLESCTSKSDGSIDKKGGKFVATDGYDGISYYYTTLDAKDDNFYLEATATVDYINPSMDGQEGFALLARDSIGEDGVSDSAFYTNSVATIASKLSYTDTEGDEHSGVKDIVGYRIFEGVEDTSKAPTAPPMVLTAGGLVDDTDEGNVTIKQGESYKISLEETDSAYIMKYYEDGAKDAKTYTYYKATKNADPLRQIDSENQYVGFAVARGCNVTFSNIKFTTSKADPKNWKERPSTPVDTDYQITSPATSSGDYTLVFKANADGTATIKSSDASGEKTVLKKGVKITANTAYSYKLPKKLSGDTTFTVVFKPDKGYKPSQYEVMSSYKKQSVSKTVTYRSFSTDKPVYVSPKGKASGKGTKKSPVDIKTALIYAKPGQNIILSEGTYTISEGLKIERGISGTKKKPITVSTKNGKGYAILDFDRTGTGLEIWGDYWRLSNIDIINSAAKGCQVAGHHNVLERMGFYNNCESGLQISGTSLETIKEWPSHNTIKNCTSMNNADKGMEDADGFGAKLTIGQGNVFDGCIAAYNADDGWDLFAKVASGPIGTVTIKNSVAYRNGFIIVKGGSKLDDSYIEENLGKDKMPESGASFNGKNFGKLKLDGANPVFTGTVINAGNGNGFKMGGSGLAGDHVLRNGVAFENKAKGIDSNSGPDIRVYDSTSFNNGSYNIAMYSNKGVKTEYMADGIISYRKALSDNEGILEIEEKIELSEQYDDITTSRNNYLWDGKEKSANAAGDAAEDSWFESVDVEASGMPVRNADGTIDMHGLLVLTDKAPADAGARLKK